jgi:hypothetical protein
MRLAAVEATSSLVRVTFKAASPLTKVKIWPSRPAVMPVMVWAAPEVSSIYKEAAEIVATSLAEPAVV